MAVEFVEASICLTRDVLSGTAALLFLIKKFGLVILYKSYHPQYPASPARFH